MIKNIQASLIVTLLVLISTTSCKKLIEVDSPDDWLESGMIFSNDSLANAAVIGLYSNIMGQTKVLLNGGMSLFGGLSADELRRPLGMNTEDQFMSNNLLTSNTLIHNNFWRAAYSYIYQCNIVLEKLQNNDRTTAAVKNRLRGEVKFVRALCYSYLINLFDMVPLALSSNAETNAKLSRSPIEPIYEQIKTDLQEAFNLLPDTIVNTKPNKMACKALLARIYLYHKEWSNAESAASYVINSGKYQLVPNLDSVFVSDSRETICQFAPVISFLNSAEGNTFIPPSPLVRANYKVTDELLAAFEIGDNRRNAWLDTSQINGFIYPFKYKFNASNVVTEYNVVLRLAEQYLIRAEARLNLENINGPVEDINVSRERAGLAPLEMTMTKAQCESALKQERRIEFFAEWGHRWIDLKRWGDADAVLKVVKGANNWQLTDQLYPIPLSEIEKNINLKQNPGYD